MLPRLGSAPVVVWWIMDFLHVGRGKWPRMSFSWLTKHACSFQAFPVCTRDFVCECVCLCMYVCSMVWRKYIRKCELKLTKPSFKGIQVCHQLKVNVSDNVKGFILLLQFIDYNWLYIQYRSLCCRTNNILVFLVYLTNTNQYRHGFFIFYSWDAITCLPTK